MDTKSVTTVPLTKSLLQVRADEHDFFRKVQGRVSIPVTDNHHWLQGVLTKTQREIQDTLNFLKRGRFFNFENVPEASAELLTQLKAIEKHFQMALKGYPSLFLDISFLGFCKEDTKLPVFMVLDLDSKFFSLSVTDRGESGVEVVFSPKVPAEIERQYIGTIKHLAEMINTYGSTATISAEFTGSPPAATRRRMEQAIKSKLFNEIFIVAEAPKWVVNVTVPAKTDPLVIGTVAIPLPNKKILKQYYLIDIFDPTPLERVVAEEYTFMPAK